MPNVDVQTDGAVCARLARDGYERQHARSS
eukprot:SAG31_NODE_33982_length_338_cov_0.644351_1_plen_29_part_10